MFMIGFHVLGSLLKTRAGVQHTSSAIELLVVSVKQECRNVFSLEGMVILCDVQLNLLLK